MEGARQHTIVQLVHRCLALQRTWQYRQGQLTGRQRWKREALG